MQKSFPTNVFSFRRESALVLCTIGASLIVGTFASSISTRSPTGPWAIVDSANGSTINDIVAVTCLSTSDCWGVGRQRNGSIWQNLIEHWDGSSWSLAASPNTSTSDDNFLYSVACTSSSQCWAVGNHSIVSNFGFAQPLIERWDGTAWTIDDSPQTSPEQQDAILSGVTCNSANDCWAVGLYVLTDFNQTLVEHWDGTSWSVVTSANTSARESNRLNAVSCTSASDCWAVGFHDVGTPVGGSAPWATLIEHWDGTAWSIVASPNEQSNTNVLNSVTCASSSDCETVGYFAIGIFFQTFVEHWDGTGWTTVSSPDGNPNDDNVFNSVTCNSASDCWAVGYFNAGDTNNVLDQTLVEHWDGSAWSIIASPNRDGFTFNELNTVTCLSASECWAAGVSDTPNAITLTEHYVAVTPVQLDAVVSRKTHGGAGTFDVDLTNGSGIECRSGGANGDYTLVFTFANTLTSIASASISNGNGSVVSGNIDSTDTHNYIVNLTGVSNVQAVRVSLNNVTDSVGNFSTTVSGQMSVLIGDTNADGFANSADISQSKSQSGQAVTGSNFREDVNADGFLNSADISLVKSKSGTGLP